VLWSIVATAATAQQVEPSEGVTLGHAASVLSAGAVYLLPGVLDINAGPPECAPCDRAAVPAFDRWVIRPEVPGVSYASTYLLAGLGAVTVLEQLRGADGARRALGTVEAASWAVGITELAKALFDRNRPVLYTDDALAEAPFLANQRSMPSGHTAAAFALAASYWLNAPERDPWLRGAALVGAVGVGVLRVVSARHFPSDVVVGAGVGIAAAIVVHDIRF
jgi:undecaprenyl-diphosphatase